MSTDTALFGNRITPACEYCEFAAASALKGFRICSKKGTVHITFSCRHYRYDPLMRVPRRPLELDRFEVPDFSTDDDT